VAPATVQPHRIRFETFELDLKAGELFLGDAKIQLQEKPFKVLSLLLEHPGEIVTRQEIQKRLWSEDTFVDFEHGINTAVRRLRQAFGDSANHPRFIETVGQRGYRFIAPLEAITCSAEVKGGRGRPCEANSLRRRRIALAAAVIVVTLGTLITLNVAGLRDHITRRAAPKIESIAVLPLENLSGDPAQENFADGMTEELITSLGKISVLRVISRTTVMHYKGTKKTLPEIARELNVDAIVEGTVSRSGNRVNVTTNLLQARADRHIWAESFEGDVQDILFLQGRVARAIAGAVRVKLTPEQQEGLSARRPIDPEAYEALLKGRHFWDIYTPESQLKCVQYYEQAIQKDPTYALAYAQMAHCYDMLAFMEYPPAGEYQRKARAAAQKALELNDQLAEAHMIYADQKNWANWDWSAAESGFRRAMELNPASVEVVGHLGSALEMQGRFDEALPLLERAVLLDPLSPTTNAFLARALFNAHQDLRAMDQYKKMLDFDPNNAGAYAGLGSLYEAEGRNDEAISAYLKAASLGGENIERVETLRRAYKAGGMKGYWKKRFDDLREQATRDRVSPWRFASFCIHAGEKELALEWLERAYDNHSPMLVWLKAERTWDSVRSDPRYQNLLRRMNFPLAANTPADQQFLPKP